MERKWNLHQTRSPALSGALQPDPRSGRDRFSLVAELATLPVVPAATDGGVP